MNTACSVAKPAYIKQMDMAWREGDVSFENTSWDKASNEQRYIILYCLAFFSQGDNELMDILNDKMNIVIKSIPLFTEDRRNWYFVQGSIEIVHDDVYKKFIEHYLSKDKKLYNMMFDRKIDSIDAKYKFMKKYAEQFNTAEELLLLQMIIELIFFSAEFCVILYFKSEGNFEDFAGANELISRDEFHHGETAIEMYNENNKPLDETFVQSIIREATEIEINTMQNAFSYNKEFILDAKDIEQRQIKFHNFSLEMLENYIKHVADTILMKINYAPIYGNVGNACEHIISRLKITNKTNMHEYSPTEYQVLIDAGSAYSGFK
jgi:ribonucleotide reductase beta subunit family protein with ferritin-like domain